MENDNEHVQMDVDINIFDLSNEELIIGLKNNVKLNIVKTTAIVKMIIDCRENKKYLLSKPKLIKILSEAELCTLDNVYYIHYEHEYHSRSLQEFSTVNCNLVNNLTNSAVMAINSDIKTTNTINNSNRKSIDDIKLTEPLKSVASDGSTLSICRQPAQACITSANEFETKQSRFQKFLEKIEK